MAIKRKDFAKGNFQKRPYTRKDHPVYKLLSKNPGLAFRADEIIKRVKMNEHTVRGMLRHLVIDGLVEHSAPYFAVKK